MRSVGDPEFADVDVRDAINAGKHPGPRLVTSGVGVTVPGGHGAGLFAHVASTPEEARAIVRDCFSHKCDLVKLFVTGGVFDAEVEGEPGVLRMSPEVAQAACDEARKLKTPPPSHIESAEGVRVGLEAGVDTIEHGAPLDDELIALFKRNGAGRASSLTCTVSPALPFVELDPAKTHSTEVQKVNGRIVFEGIVQAAKQALAAGIPVGLGTDSSCPYITQYDMWREVVYFERIVGASRRRRGAARRHRRWATRILGLVDPAWAPSRRATGLFALVASTPEPGGASHRAHGLWLACVLDASCKRRVSAPWRMERAGRAHVARGRWRASSRRGSLNWTLSLAASCRRRQKRVCRVTRSRRGHH